MGGDKRAIVSIEDLGKVVMSIRLDRPLSDSTVCWASQKLVLGDGAFLKGHPSASFSPRHMVKCLPGVDEQAHALDGFWSCTPISN